MLRKGLLVLAGMLAVAGTASAGPIFLTGHDPDFHALDSTGAKNLLTAGLDYVTGGTTFSGSEKFLWVQARPADIGGIPGGHRDGIVAGLNAIGLTEGVQFDVANAAALPGIDFSSYTAIAIASSFGGLLTRAELDALIARAGDIATFINNGGGLFASAECFPCGADLLAGDTPPALYGYLPVVVSSIPASPPFAVTPFGNLTFGLVSTDLNDPTHNSFGAIGGLNPVDLDNSGQATTLAADVRIDDGGFVPEIPEPASLALFSAGLLGFGWIRRRRSLSHRG